MAKQASLKSKTDVCDTDFAIQSVANGLFLRSGGLSRGDARLYDAKAERQVQKCRQRM